MHVEAPTYVNGEVLTRWRKTYWWTVALIATTLAIFSPAVFAHQPLAPGDGWRVNLPLRSYATRQLAAGNFPSWNPYQFGGVPLHALSQASITYPPTALHLAFSDTTANFLWTLTAYLVAAGGTAALVKRWTGDNAAAATSGIAFAFSGFMMAHLGHPAMVSTIAYLPAALWALDRCIERLTLNRICVAGLITGIGMLAGHPQMVLVVVAVLLLWATISGLLAKQRLRPLLAAILVLCFAGSIAAVQLLPTAYFLSESDRSELTYDQAMDLDLPQSHLPLLIFPQAYGAVADSAVYAGPYQGDGNLAERAGYVGAAALILAAFAWTQIRKSPKAAALGIVALIALLTALGDDTPLSQVIYRIPIAGQVRAWNRYVVVLDLAIAVFAGFGVAKLRKQTKTTGKDRIRVLSTLGALAAAAVAIPLLPTVRDLAVGNKDLLTALVVPLAFSTLIAALILAQPRSRRLIGILCFAIVTIDSALSVAWFSEWRMTTIDNQTAIEAISPELAPSFGLPFEVGPEVNRVLYVGTYSYPMVRDFPPMSTSREIRWVNGSEPLAPATFTDNVGSMAANGILANPGTIWAQDSLLLDLLQVTTVISDRDWQPPPNINLLPHEGEQDKRLQVWYREPMLPDAFIVGGNFQVQDGASMLNDPAVAALRLVPYEGSCSECISEAAPGPAGVVLSTTWDEQEVLIEVSTERPAMLVVSQAFSPGWKATIEETEVPVLRAYGTVQAIPIPAGSYEVRLSYEAPGLRLGVWLSSLAILICLFSLAATVLARLRAPPGDH